MSNNPPNARDLLAKLLLGSSDGVLSAREAVAACALFGIRQNSTRVALMRLSGAGMIEATGRGTYRIGPRSSDLADEVRAWRGAEARVRKWSGAWLAVHTGDLLRGDRVAWRKSERALHMLGFRALSLDLFVRPDNLVGGANAVRTRLGKLGLGDAAMVFVANAFEEALDTRARALWDGRELSKSYVAMRRKLESWLERSTSLDLAAAARESFLLGNRAIRQLVFDPLLPDPLVDAAARHAFVQCVLRFDAAGHAIWAEVLRAARTQDAPSSDTTRALRH